MSQDPNSFILLGSTAGRPPAVAIQEHCVLCQVCPYPTPLLYYYCRLCDFYYGHCPNGCGSYSCGMCRSRVEEGFSNSKEVTDFLVVKYLVPAGATVGQHGTPSSPVAVPTSSPSTPVGAAQSIASRAGPSRLDFADLPDQTGQTISWEIIKEGSRKKKDLLKDSRGYSYSKRNGSVWQCSRKCAVKTQRNKCSASVKEENGQYILSDTAHSCEQFQ